MSDFRDLQKIYENAWTFGPNRNRFYSGAESQTSLSTGPGQLPVQGPGGRVNAYNLNSSSSSNPIRFGEAEEDRAISSNKVLTKIRAIKEDAIRDGMDYAVFVLSSLEEFIISSNENQ